MIRNVLKKKICGFTLAELLVVVAIIAILVAISIPIFTSRLEKARAATCDANRRSLKAELTTDYMSGKEFPTESISNTTIRKDYSKNFDFDTFCPSDGIITAEFDGSSFTVYCSEHKSQTALGDNKTMKSILDALILQKMSPIDSTALADNTSFAKKVYDALSDAGIDLSKLGATSWRFTNNNKNESRFYWTPKDISQMSEGDKTPVICYNPNSGNYTVWTATIGMGSRTQGKKDYNTLSSFAEYKPSTGTTADGNQTYETALDYYKKALNQ